MSATTAMVGRVCMITGANGGIGKETALALAEMGATGIIVARESEKGRVLMSS